MRKCALLLLPFSSSRNFVEIKTFIFVNFKILHIAMYGNLIFNVHNEYFDAKYRNFDI